MQAQNIIAENEGFNNWHDFKEKIKKYFYNFEKNSSEPPYIYSTIKTKPQAGYFLLGFKEHCFLNIWSSKRIFKLHSVNFMQEKSTYKYQVITEFIKAGNFCLIVDSNEKQITDLQKNSGVHISCLNEEKLRAIKVTKEALKSLLQYSYLCANPENIETEKCTEINLLGKIIDSLFSKNSTVMFNQEVLVRIKTNLFTLTNSTKFDFLNGMIESFIYSDTGKKLKLDEGVYYIKSPTIYDKNYHHFNIILMWYLNYCTGQGFSENEQSPLNIENANIFYFNPVFFQINQNYNLNSQLRAFKATIHYYFSYKNKYYTSNFVFSNIVPNSMKLTFERVNNEKIIIENEYLFNAQVNNRKCTFINVENKNKIIYSVYNNLFE